MYMCKSLRDAKLNQSRARQNQASVLSLGVQKDFWAMLQESDVSGLVISLWSDCTSMPGLPPCESCTELMGECLLSTLYVCGTLVAWQRK